VQRARALIPPAELFRSDASYSQFDDQVWLRVPCG
jgi:hypothetical protein